MNRKEAFIKGYLEALAVREDWPPGHFYWKARWHWTVCAFYTILLFIVTGWFIKCLIKVQYHSFLVDNSVNVENLQTATYSHETWIARNICGLLNFLHQYTHPGEGCSCIFCNVMRQRLQ